MKRDPNEIHVSYQGDWPDLGIDGCCIGSAAFGPGRCTCWEPVYDLDQQEPRTDQPAGLQSDMCADCAYRPGSPERAADELAGADQDDLDRLVRDGSPFWCHQGMRRPTHYVHPSGATFVPEGVHLSYRPPQVGGVPYQADGSPGLLCAGWAQRRLVHLRDHPATTEGVTP